jgi:hypothetical protein
MLGNEASAGQRRIAREEPDALPDSLTWGTRLPWLFREACDGGQIFNSIKGLPRSIVNPMHFSRVSPGEPEIFYKLRVNGQRSSEDLPNLAIFAVF